MRSIILTIGTLIAHRLDSLNTIEWILVGILGLIAVFGDLFIFEQQTRERPRPQINITNPFTKKEEEGGES